MLKNALTFKLSSALVYLTFGLLFLIALPNSIFAQTPAPNGISGNWNLIFQDEFDGSSLDLTKWRPNWLGGSDTSITKPINDAEISCYDPKQVTLTNGELHLTAEKRSCNGYQYASGMVESDGKFNFSYGFAEARIWTPAGQGLWPAFWTDGQNWPNDGEIDILEAYGDNISTYHYHYAGCGGDCGPGGEVTIPGATSGWHTYATNWEPGKITWYYDGNKVWEYSTGIISSPHYLIANFGVNENPAAVPATMRIDYIRVWKKDTSSPSPSPSPTPTLIPSPTPTPSPSPSLQPSPSPSSPTPSPSPSASPLSTCNVADFNQDGKVDLLDFTILRYNFLKQTSAVQNPRTDLNGDGVINLRDFSIFIQQLGQHTPC